MSDNHRAGLHDRLRAVRTVVDGVRVVTVHGEIDHDGKDTLSRALLTSDGTPTPQRIVADLSGVTFMDSSGVNVFVTVYQQVSAAHGWLRIAGAQESVLRVLQIVGIDTLIPCLPSTEEALSA
ncbi:STAS domain-containing protein [Streptomyces griseorubiginosus]|uniref:STAS domain-containing protein n=1 Tax=Streptomyces griseorubiginosus TaxID=67304 RepID=UPI0033D89BDC